MSSITIGLLIITMACSLSCGVVPRRYVIENSLRKETKTKVNINSASVDELQAVPGIGEGLAKRIVGHRQRYGRFQRTEHLLLVRGMSERKYKQIITALVAE